MTDDCGPCAQAAAIWETALTAATRCGIHGTRGWCEPCEQAIDAAANQAETDRLYREAGL